MKHMNLRRTLRAVLAAALAGMMALSFTACDWPFPIDDKDIQDADKMVPGQEDIVYAGCLTRMGYTLEEAVVLSRHNIRAPLVSGGSLLGDITPHEWVEWTSDASELSVRGGVLESEMGQYFRQWLEAEGLFEKNEKPEKDEVRFYANSKQRTIATARFFSTGLLPTTNVDVETHMEFDKMDPVFTPQLTFATDAYKADAEKQIREKFTKTIEDLSDNYTLLTDVIDMKDSLAWKEGTVKEFATDDSEFKLEVNAEPGVSGSLKTACSVSDALVLQYYEEPDLKKAGFDHELTTEQWKAIAEIKDVYGDVLFTAPLVAANVAHPLLEEIQKELTADGRKFAFLCGHDSNVGSVLAAMGAEDYSLPYTIERKTPIGCKLVFCRWRSEDGKSFVSVDLVYQTASQLRDATVLVLNEAPVTFPIQFSGMTLANEKWNLYAEEDFMARLQDAIDDYDEIVEQYSDEEEIKKAA